MGWLRAGAPCVPLEPHSHRAPHRHDAIRGDDRTRAEYPQCGVFGCDAFVHQDRTQRDTTFSPKAEPGIYLGHDSRQNCAVVRMLHTGKTVRVKDVLFREGSFTARASRAQWTRRREVKNLDLADVNEESSREMMTKHHRCSPPEHE